MTPNRLLAGSLILLTAWMSACSSGQPDLTGNASTPASASGPPPATATATACPPVTTPERGMPDEAAQVEGDLAARGVKVRRVSAIGFVVCPPYTQKPEDVSWLIVEVTVDDAGDREAVGRMMEKVMAMLEKWPVVQVQMILYEASGPAERSLPSGTPSARSFTFTKAQIDKARRGALKDGALLDALGY
jgi:hypothetical protein